MLARKVIQRLMNEKSSALSDVKRNDDMSYDLSKVDGNTAPSELKRISAAIAKKRLLAEGLERKELDELMSRLGKRRRK